MIARPQSFLGLLSLLGLLPLTSCLEMEQTVVLESDGSGVQKFSMTMRESTMDEVRRAAAAVHTGGALEPTAVFDKEIVERELVDAGFELREHEATKAHGKRTVKLAAAFADFATLQKTPLGGSQAEWVLAKGPKEGTAKLTVYPQGREAWLEGRRKAEALKADDDPLVAQFFARRRQQLAGLDLVLRLEVPGQVYLWTKNMKKVGDRSVEARVSAADIKTPEDMIRRLSPRFEVVFDARDCTLPLR
ncbi:MAG: hypothetical protein KDC98_12195 [Planctomycetes bacterium]|nr:hypothetical protein [Planctomycetota bacterium]